MQTFSSKEFRSTVGAFATGVTVVTTRGEEHAYGMTANAFSSVSLDPPLILVCAISPSEGADHISRNGVFAVNILAEDQEPVQELAVQGAGEPFTDRVHPRRPDRGVQDRGAAGLEDGVEGAGEVRAAIADQEPDAGEPLVEGEGQIAACCTVHSPVG